MINSAWYHEELQPEAIEITEARKLSMHSGPVGVEARLLNTTKSREHAKWKTKDELEEEEAIKRNDELAKYRVVGGIIHSFIDF